MGCSISNFFEQAATAYRTRDADARNFEAQFNELSAHSRTCDANNVELVKIGNELVARFRDKSFGDLVKSSEPLTQVGRVRLEELAQDYHVKITDLAVPVEAKN